MAGAFAAIILPEGFYFLQLGWWVLHIAAITLVFLIGHLFGSRSRMRQETESSGEGFDISDLPVPYRFLRRRWWMIHIAAITLVFILGHLLWPST